MLSTSLDKPMSGLPGGLPWRQTGEISDLTVPINNLQMVSLMASRESMEGLIVDSPNKLTQINYNITDAAISELRNLYSALVITDSASYKSVVSAIAVIRTKRTDVEKKRKELKAYALEWSRLVDAEAKRITNLLIPIEENLKSIKKAEDDKREKIRLQAEQAERERIAEINQKIEAIRNKVRGLFTKNTDEIKTLLIEISEIQIMKEEYQEFLPVAAAAKDLVLDQTSMALKNKLDQEKRDQEIKLEMERLEKIRIQQEIEQKRIAQEKLRLEIDLAHSEAILEDQKRSGSAEITKPLRELKTRCEQSQPCQKIEPQLLRPQTKNTVSQNDTLTDPAPLEPLPMQNDIRLLNNLTDLLSSTIQTVNQSILPELHYDLPREIGEQILSFLNSNLNFILDRIREIQALFN